MTLMNRLVAEAVGTFCLVFAGCLAIVVNDTSGGALTHLGISAVFGLVVMAMIYSLGNVSGAHLNPAVTFAFAGAKKLPWSEAFAYSGAQISGALLASTIIFCLFPSHPTQGATLPSAGVWPSFVVEIILTFILMLVIFNVSTGHKEKGIMAGAAVGATVMLDAAIGGPLTGASMNPARSFAPAVYAGELHTVWIYFAAPIIGAQLAAPFCKWIQGDECCSEDKE